MKSILAKSLWLALVSGPGAESLLNAADCLPSASAGSSAPFTMITLNNYASGIPFATYTTGAFSISITHFLFGSAETFSSGGSTQLFSNRYSNCGGLCEQPFSVNQPNNVGVSVT